MHKIHIIYEVIILNSFINSSLEEKISYLNKINIETMIEGDYLEVKGKISDVFTLKNKEDEIFILVNFDSNGIFNENVQILYDSSFTPFAKLAYSINKRDNRVSFDYFFVTKELRGQHIGQSMINFLFNYLEDMLGEFEIYTNPFSFDVSFNGIKGYDYSSQLYQYKLEQFYYNNGFILTEDPKKYVFGDYDYIPEYNFTEKPEYENDIYFIGKHTLSFPEKERY